ncbi:flavin monoamine oxidase family protein [Mycobacterium spongiae]|uniref:FAD-dependent oxidoreductase n=1 Tax=Mycobacterium spongiae TaxID=886343 RepID=A0A975PXH2_9MYCO|nr:flavin monoamine oxidase family protein [Mycobacterium spongiae]QUR67814.1 FAD-dependent oxidoreductase [Mycobacterium spongiae]
MTTPDISADVVVVGAGFAGLSAARELTQRGHDTIVLEGRNRVGGRTWTATIAGVPVDLGATFVGPTQDAVLKLVAELGIKTMPMHAEGTSLIRWRGRVRKYHGTFPQLSPVELIDLGRVRWQLNRLQRRVRLRDPWTSPNAATLDTMTLQDWLWSIRATESTHDLMAMMSLVTWGCEPAAVSMLHAARYIKAAGGLDRLLNVKGGAQQDRTLEGTQQIALQMAEELGDRVIVNAPVRAVNWDDSGVTVTADHMTVRARLVIMAIAPAHRAAIDFQPALPSGCSELMQRWPQGSLGKFFVAYETPFWRRDGLSGASLADEGPVFSTFDYGPNVGGPGIMLGFTKSRSFDPLSPQQRQEQVLASLGCVFGPEAWHPIDYIDQTWATESFAPGGPTAAVPPGSWTRYGPWLRKPIGPIHWAGTETADEWTGFLDGAVRSGRRAAAEIAAKLSG